MTHQPLRWTIAPLEDTTVTEIVLPKKNVDSLRRLSTTTTERTGLIYAVQGEQALYFVGYHILGIGTRTNCTFDQRYQTFQHQFTVRAKEKLPTLTTVLYHNHPRPTIEEQTPEALKHIQKELQAGIFDYLQDVGKEPTTEEALAEMSRTLSPADHRATFGRIHLLLTDTATQGYDFHTSTPTNSINKDYQEQNYSE
ncbi:MAG: hypothetical protein Q7R56_01630 [Nanoarchaeota archaeon]|nr:hypothetical protein [Nanoarchaeota archaeon]